MSWYLIFPLFIRLASVIVTAVNTGIVWTPKTTKVRWFFFPVEREVNVTAHAVWRNQSEQLKYNKNKPGQQVTCLVNTQIAKMNVLWRTTQARTCQLILPMPW